MEEHAGFHLAYVQSSGYFSLQMDSCFLFRPECLMTGLRLLVFDFEHLLMSHYFSSFETAAFCFPFWQMFWTWGLCLSWIQLHCSLICHCCHWRVYHECVLSMECSMILESFHCSIVCLHHQLVYHYLFEHALLSNWYSLCESGLI